ncbi:21973_t:CDS:1, partial [Gigaspora rosea]
WLKINNLEVSTNTISNLKVLQVAIDELSSDWEEVLEVTSLNHLDLSKYDIGPNRQTILKMRINKDSQIKIVKYQHE